MFIFEKKKIFLGLHGLRAQVSEVRRQKSGWHSVLKFERKGHPDQEN